MTIHTRRFVVEFNLAYLFVKANRWECFVSFERDGGPVGRRIILEREGSDASSEGR